MLKKIDEQGHQVANHSYSHAFFFDFYSSKRMIDELKQTDELIYSVISKKPKYFRPPYGVVNPNVAKAIRGGNYFPVGWSVRSLDTVIKDPGKLMSRVTKSISSGDIFLFHDTSDSTKAILSDFIKHVQQQGFTFVRLDNLLKEKPYE